MRKALLRLRANRSLRLINHDRTRVNDSKGPSCVACSLLLGLLVSISGASAQEYELPALRGSQPSMPTERAASTCCSRWGGFYAGGQVSHSSASADYRGGVGDLAAFIVRDSIFEAPVSGFTTLPNNSTNAFGFGGFFGYNSVWEELILGWELNYIHTSLNSRSADSLSRTLADNTGAPPGHNFVYNVTVNGIAHIRVTDMLMLRGRAGWTVGNFLPYAFLAPGIARADVTRAATVTLTRMDNPDVTVPPTDPILIPDFFGQSRTDIKNAGYYFAYAAGIGLDVEVMPRVFVRLEWETLQMPDVQGMAVGIQTLRTGLGMKF